MFKGDTTVKYLILFIIGLMTTAFPAHAGTDYYKCSFDEKGTKYTTELRRVSNGKSLLTVVHDHDLTQYEVMADIEDLSLREFSDVLDHNGIILESNKVYPYESHYLYWNDGLRVLASTYGDLDAAYYEDLNNDGIRELIGNCTYGDGVENCIVYTVRNNKVYFGFSRELLGQEHRGLYYRCRYNPDTGMLEYGQDDNDKIYISIQDVDLSELCIEDYRNEDGLEYLDLYIDEVDADLYG